MHCGGGRPLTTLLRGSMVRKAAAQNLRERTLRTESRLAITASGIVRSNMPRESPQTLRRAAKSTATLRQRHLRPIQRAVISVGRYFVG